MRLTDYETYDRLFVATYSPGEVTQKALRAAWKRGLVDRELSEYSSRPEYRYSLAAPTSTDTPEES